MIVHGSPTDRLSGLTETSPSANLPIAPVKCAGLPSCGSGRISSLRAGIEISNGIFAPEPKFAILSNIDIFISSSIDISRPRIPFIEKFKSYVPTFSGVMTVW